MDLKFSLRVHTASVTCLDLVQSLGDNKLNGNNALVSGDQSGRLVFWDLLLRRPIHQWIGHDGAIIQVGTYTLENQLFIVSQGRDDCIRIWNSKYQLFKSFAVNSLHFCQFKLNHLNHIVFIQPNDTIDVLNLSTLQLIPNEFTYPTTSGSCLALEWYSDSQILVGSDDGSLHMLSITGIQMSLKCHSEPVLSIAVLNDTIVSAGASQKIVVCTLKSDKLAILWDIDLESQGLSQVVAFPFKSQLGLVTAGWDSKLRLFKQTKQLAVKQEHRKSIRCLAIGQITDHGNTMNVCICGSDDTRISVWDIHDEK